MLSHRLGKFFVVSLTCATVVATAAHACSRFTYQAGDSGYFVGRTMDWPEDTQADLWVFPAGMERNGGAGENSLEWTSKYGSTVVSFYDSFAVDGMNEAGLVANHQVLAEADYGEPNDTNHPRLSIGAEMQYILDNFATVGEAVESLTVKPYQVVQTTLFIRGIEVTPHGHIAITDATGDNAILEWTDGELEIYHSRDYTVMTNSPTYDQQIAINNYWQDVGGEAALPGTHRAADRFVRLAFNLDAVESVEDSHQATATTFSLIRNISVPLGIADPENPNLSSTQYRTVADIAQMRYYYEGALNPSLFWVDFESLDLSVGAPVKRLNLRGAQFLAGEISESLVKAEAFDWTVPKAGEYAYSDE